MSLYIPKMSDTPAITIPGLANNFDLLADGRIVEQGSNEKGRYFRWENGRQLCIGTISAQYAGVEVQNLGTYTFPAAFVETPTVAMALEVQSDAGVTSIRGSLSAYGILPGSIPFVVATIFLSSSHRRLIAHIIAEGRWK